MQIIIDTDGIGTNTRVRINGQDETTLRFFEFSVNVDRSNKAKLVMTKLVDGKYMPLEFFGEGLRKFDEAQEINKGAANGRHLGAEVKRTDN